MDPPQRRAREPMPEHLVPMLARAGELPADDADWAFEIKWDGVRAITYSQPGALRMESRNLIEVSRLATPSSPTGPQLGSRSAILDGEIVAFDERGRAELRASAEAHARGLPSAGRRRAADQPVTYMIFDLL